MWFPIFLVIQNRQANCSRRVNIWMRKNWFKHTLWWSWLRKKLPNGKVMSKVHSQSISSLFPGCSFRSRNLTYPLHHVHWPIFFVFHRFGYETEGMVTSPIFSLLFETIYNQLVNLFFIHSAHVVKEIMNIFDGKSKYKPLIRSQNLSECWFQKINN